MDILAYLTTFIDLVSFKRNCLAVSTETLHSSSLAELREKQKEHVTIRRGRSTEKYSKVFLSA